MIALQIVLILMYPTQSEKLCKHVDIQNQINSFFVRLSTSHTQFWQLLPAVLAVALQDQSYFSDKRQRRYS